jgi:hypothetical protein
VGKKRTRACRRHLEWNVTDLKRSNAMDDCDLRRGTDQLAGRSRGEREREREGEIGGDGKRCTDNQDR